ncbi:prolipoprotein diacylglyceryl transferase [Acetobacteraceae bacterium]|nr:prolipoprotein diacylglyceryl transferase [Acetobacteraceae bacterium]QCE34986.1 prolipoprotein diacylglyceryl transferase [Acetobacteraceae bacterium]
MSSPLIFPEFDAVAFHLPFPVPGLHPLSITLIWCAVRWYGLAYMTAFLLAMPIAHKLCSLRPVAATRKQVDDFLFFAILGVILGGRLGYVLCYQPFFYLTHPLEIFVVWNGGMSFHGGCLGVVLALAWFSYKEKISFLAFSDRVVTLIPIGLGLGRCANFINGELWGRPVQMEGLPWAMIYPHVDSLPRHPSEIYEALMEGLLLFSVLLFSISRPALRSRPGFTAGLFLSGYASARMFCECFREPDWNIGFLAGGVTMGQILSVPMLLFGIYMMVQAFRHLPFEGDNLTPVPENWSEQRKIISPLFKRAK